MAEMGLELIDKLCTAYMHIQMGNWTNKQLNHILFYGCGEVPQSSKHLIEF